MEDKESFITHYVKFFVAFWGQNISNATMTRYHDHPNSSTRILALTLAQTAWEMKRIEDDGR